MTNIVLVAFTLTNLRIQTRNYQQKSHINAKNAPIKDIVIVKLASENITADMEGKDMDTDYAQMNAPDPKHMDI